MSREYDQGTATWEGQSVYWDKNSDGSINIFTGGMPSSRSSQDYHDKIILEGADLQNHGFGYRIEGGRVTFKRVNGTIVINERGSNY